MSFLDKALEKAKEIKKEEKEKIKKSKILEEEDKLKNEEMNKLIDEVLNEFDGVKGIVRRGNELYKKDVLIAKIGIKWETWNDPNYEYPVECGGNRIRWEVLNKGKIIMTGCDFDYFAASIAIHLV